MQGYRGQVVTGDDLFHLYDTFGFPVELSVEEAGAEGLELSPDWHAQFEAQLAQQRARSQAASRAHG